MTKGLEAFKQLIKGHYLGRGEYEVLCSLIEKELEALELLKYAYKSKVFYLDIYYNNEHVIIDGEDYHYVKISKEKFDLLKEVLEYEETKYFNI